MIFLFVVFVSVEKTQIRSAAICRGSSDVWFPKEPDMTKRQGRMEIWKKGNFAIKGFELVRRTGTLLKDRLSFEITT